MQVDSCCGCGLARFGAAWSISLDEFTTTRCDFKVLGVVRLLSRSLCTLDRLGVNFGVLFVGKGKFCFEFGLPALAVQRFQVFVQLAAWQ